MYLDANNLHGWAMSQPLPVSEFQSVGNADELQETITEYPVDSFMGCMLEVDLEHLRS